MEPDRWLGLDLRHLVALKAIADAGSFGKAAEKLGYTQAAISQQIATLDAIVRALPDRASGRPQAHLAHRGGAHPAEARRRDPGTAARGEGRHEGARGRR